MRRYEPYYTIRSFLNCRNIVILKMARYVSVCVCVYESLGRTDLSSNDNKHMRSAHSIAVKRKNAFLTLLFSPLNTSHSFFFLQPDHSTQHSHIQENIVIRCPCIVEVSLHWSYIQLLEQCGKLKARAKQMLSSLSCDRTTYERKQRCGNCMNNSIKV